MLSSDFNNQGLSSNGFASTSDFEDFGDPRLIEIPLPHPINGVRYNLREPSGDAIIAWRSTQFRGASINRDGQSAQIGQGMFESEYVLIQKCLCKTTPEGATAVDRNGDPILENLSTIKKFPSRVLRPLFKKCIQLSRVEEEENEDALQKRLEETQEKLDQLRKGKSEAKN